MTEPQPRMPEPTGPAAAQPTPAAATPPQPSIHMRAFITWLAVFPLVAICLTVLHPLIGTWPGVLQALVLTAIVVPTAVYLVVPRLLNAYGALRAKWTVR